MRLQAPIFGRFSSHPDRHKSLPPATAQKRLPGAAGGLDTAPVRAARLSPKVHRRTQDLVFDLDLMTISC